MVTTSFILKRAKIINNIIYIKLIGVIMTTTTVAVSHETKELLRQIGEKGESYDDIINKLIKEVSIKKLDERWNRILEEEEFIPLDEL